MNKGTCLAITLFAAEPEASTLSARTTHSLGTQRLTKARCPHSRSPPIAASKSSLILEARFYPTSHASKENTMKIEKTFLSVLATLLWLGLSSNLFAADLSLGTWKLNLAKSKYNPGPAPKSATFTLEAAEGGVKRTGESTDAEGKKTSYTWTAKYDGKDYPVTGSDRYDAVSLKRIDDHSSEIALKKSGKVITSGKRTLSKDGKVMTLTIATTNAKGEKANNVAVYDKQ
jgi:hypothetical protein